MMCVRMRWEGGGVSVVSIPVSAWYEYTAHGHELPPDTCPHEPEYCNRSGIHSAIRRSFRKCTPTPGISILSMIGILA